jgi:predicted nucleic acid-binding protein
MRILLDTSLLVEGERRNFDLGRWVVAARHEVFICDATVAEYIAGKPLKDAGKEQRWQNYWDSFVSLLESVPLDHQVCEKPANFSPMPGAPVKPCLWATVCTPLWRNWKI